MSQQQHHHHHHSTASSSFASCFFPTADKHPPAILPPPPPPPPPPPQTVSGKPNLTTCLYQTHLGLFSLTWSRTFIGHSLHLNLHPVDFSSPSPSSSSSPLFSLSNNSPSLSTLSFHLHIKPFLFWKKHGSKKLTTANTTAVAASSIRVFWDLSKAKFGSGPEPQSGFYIAVVFDGEMTLLVGDSTKEAYSKTRAQLTPRTNQVLVLRREHVFGNKVYTTKAKFGGKTREISIDCSVNSDARLCFSVDNKRVLQIKRLKWKFRGNERIEVDGVSIQVSWDVYNWLFEDLNNNGHAAVFMFRFENPNNEDEEEKQEEEVKNDVVSWKQPQKTGSFSFGGMNGIEWKKMTRKSLMMRTARSSSLSSISMTSSAASSSGCSSSVMEWNSSTEESDLCPGFNGFSLLVYVWKK
ncbi:hypothetical protein Dsin_016199 [Dipteronia sinensis]|uniref:DUF868 family protein n=1 Tax=Dipteronia sinensis TaxID=43782 RepID=A0AAE0E6Q3_9ROSI|nr:hypothetical protein Dsin_016199 [Dipteronia sinensis]